MLTFLLSLLVLNLISLQLLLYRTRGSRDVRSRLATDCPSCRLQMSSDAISGIFGDARSTMRAESRAYKRQQMNETTLPIIIDPE